MLLGFEIIFWHDLGKMTVIQSLLGFDFFRGVSDLFISQAVWNWTESLCLEHLE